MTKLHTTYSILALFSLFTFFGCNKTAEELLFNDNSNKDAIQFKLRIPGMMFPSTYSLDQAKEERIDEIEILLFHKNAQGQFTYEKAPISLTKNQIQIDPTTHEAVFAANIVPANGSDEYILGIIANPTADIKSIIGGLSTNEGKEKVMGELRIQTNVKWETGNNFTPIPMYSETSSLVLKSRTKITGLAFTRALAKIDINVSQSVSNFKLISVSLFNYNIRGYVTPEWNTSNGILSQNPGLHKVPNSSTNRPLVYPCINNSSIQGDIYTFEADKGVPYLIIKGEYKGKEGYYRVDFKQTKGSNPIAEPIPLERNHQYIINITQVLGNGRSTENEAQNDMSTLSNMNTKLLSYDLNDNLDRFVFNGSDFIGTDRDSIFFSENGGQETISLGVSPGNTIKATISGQGGNWATSQAITANNKITISCPFNSAATRRDAILKLTAGNLTKDILLSQDGYSQAKAVSNCYIVQAGESGIKIPFSQAIEGNKAAGHSISNTDITKVDLLWTDCPLGIGSNSVLSRLLLIYDHNDNNPYIYVSPGSSVGNAMIAARDKNNNILWSWHIWVVSFNKPSELYSKNSAGGPMQCNLGATSFIPGSPGSIGLFYQWGRKDPFPGMDVNNPNALVDLYDENGHSIYKSSDHSIMPIVQQINGIDNLLKSIQYPDIYYTDWLNNSSSSPYTDLWYDNNPKVGSQARKNIYWDPCPVGYRVMDPNDLTNSGLAIQAWNQGKNYSLKDGAGVFYPAEGYVIQGKLTNNNEGWYWTSQSAQALNFNSTQMLNPVNAINRERATPIRCVKKS